MRDSGNTACVGVVSYHGGEWCHLRDSSVFRQIPTHYHFGTKSYSFFSPARVLTTSRFETGKKTVYFVSLSGPNWILDPLFHEEIAKTWRSLSDYFTT